MKKTKILVYEGKPGTARSIGKAIDAFFDDYVMYDHRYGDNYADFLLTMEDMTIITGLPKLVCCTVDATETPLVFFQSVSKAMGSKFFFNAPFIVFCKGLSLHQIQTIYHHGAKSVIEIPDGEEDFIKVIHDAFSYWLRTVRLPVFVKSYNTLEFLN